MESSVLAPRELWTKATLAVVAAGCVATTCYAPIGFDLRGDLESGVVFRIADSTGSKERVTVEEVVFGEVAGLEVWRLEGHASVEEVVYGEPQPGLLVKVEPAPLQPERAYYIVVRGDASWGRQAWGTCSFAIDGGGRVQPEPGC